jgi:serine/threonine-protein kinase
MRVCPKCNAVYEATGLKFCRRDGTTLAAVVPEAHLAIGSVLNESLRVLEVVRADRFGVVYRVEDVIAPGRALALRLFRSGFVTPAVFEAFGALADRLRASLREPDVLAGFIPVQLEDGREALLGDDFPGTTLDVVIAREAPLAPWVVATTLLRIAEVLGGAHRVGLYHGNLTAENVILADRTARTFAVKVAEFGVASTIRAHNGRSLPSSGDFSLLRDYNNYYAPELVTAHAHEADARTDVFSLGALCYHMLSGWIPFSESALEGPSTVYATDDPRPLATLNKDLGVPRALEETMLKALERDPDRRFGSLAELVDALQEIQLDLSFMPALAPVPRKPTRPRAPRKAARREAPQPAPRRVRTNRGGTRTAESGRKTAAYDPASDTPASDQDSGGQGAPPARKGR